MNTTSALGAWWQRRRRRRVIDGFKDSFEIIEVEWRPTAQSPLGYEQSTLKLPLDGIIGPRTLVYGHWHDEHTRLVREKLRLFPGKKFLVDVGANLGLITRQLMAPDVGQWTGAICFEPERRNLERLRWNVQPLPNVGVVGSAISDADAMGVLHVDEGNAGDCSLEPLPSGISRAGVSQQTVSTLSGASALRLINARRSEGDRIVWKSDTQGHDLRIIRAMPDELWSDTDIAMVEVRCSSATDAEIDHLMRVASMFSNRASIKRHERRIELSELEAFCRRRSASEFDLLLWR